jgi:TPR repeat protein
MPQPEDLASALKACEQTRNPGMPKRSTSWASSTTAVPRHLDKALKWFEKASLQGHAQSQYRLGSMFFHGEGVKANNVQAYILLKMAAVNGAEDALDMADEVTEQMPRDELEHATQVLGQIFRKYLLELQNAEGRTPFSL